MLRFLLCCAGWLYSFCWAIMTVNGGESKVGCHRGGVDLRNWNLSADAGDAERPEALLRATSVSTFSLAVVTIASRTQSSGRSKSFKGWLCGIPLLAQDARRGAPVIADPERSSILG